MTTTKQTELLPCPFKREERFIVIKRKHMHDYIERDLRSWLRSNDIPTSECVVVESDWPEYEQVWAMIEARINGTAQSAPEPVQGEAVEVVAYLKDRGAEAPTLVAIGSFYDREPPIGWIKDHQRAEANALTPLMTVTQHKRIMAADCAGQGKAVAMLHAGGLTAQDATRLAQLPAGTKLYTAAAKPDAELVELLSDARRELIQSCISLEDELALKPVIDRIDAKLAEVKDGA